MYSVSQTYIDKLKELSVKHRRISGRIGTLQFTEDDILSGSFGYTEQAVGSSDVKLGGVFIGQMNITFLPSFASQIARGSWKGLEINISIGLKVATNEWEFVPLKPYIIDDATHSASGVACKAYDVMGNFDKDMSISTTSGEIFDFLEAACNACHVTLGQTREQIHEMANGSATLGLYPTNDIETWRDMISWAAVTVGGFATINRNGQLELRSWSDTPVLTLNRNDRFAGGTWSDFVTYYTGVSIVNIEEETTSYYGTSTGDTGLTMNLGANPLLQYGTTELKTAQRRAVLEALQKFQYTPFKSISLFDPALDLGDIIRYDGGLAGDEYSICCVMRIDYKYATGCTLQGYGKNPALFGAKSKADKNISGLLSRTTESTYATLTYVNLTEFTLGELQQTQVVSIRFASVKPKTVAMFHEINLDVTLAEGSDIATCTVEYYLDGSKILYSPVATWNNSGKHILSLMYFLNTFTQSGFYTWEVRLTMSGGTATIATNECRAMLQGQGIVEYKEWDGNIEFIGENAIYIPSYVINAIYASTITAATDAHLYDNENTTANEVIALMEANGISAFQLTDDTMFIDIKNPDYVKRAGEGYYAGGIYTTGLL